jgi:hypothetical protein
VLSPKNPEEENVFTRSADEHMSAFLAGIGKDWKATIKANKYFMWTAIAFCTLLFLLFWYGLSVIKEYSRDFSYYIAHETRMSEQRAVLDQKKFSQDSAMQVRHETRELKKEKRDSISWVRSNKAMDHYEALPDYKNESK